METIRHRDPINNRYHHWHFSNSSVLRGLVRINIFGFPSVLIEVAGIQTTDVWSNHDHAEHWTRSALTHPPAHAKFPRAKLKFVCHMSGLLICYESEENGCWWAPCACLFANLFWEGPLSRWVWWGLQVKGPCGSIRSDRIGSWWHWAEFLRPMLLLSVTEDLAIWSFLQSDELRAQSRLKAV